MNPIHPPPEIIAAMAEGKLARTQIARMLEHIEECPACREELRLASVTLEEEATPRRWMPLAVAAGLLLVLIPGAWIWNARRSRSPIDSLASLAPRSSRIIEPRLSGGFAYAPYAGRLRGSDAEADAQRLKLGGAAGSVIEDAQRNPSADAQHAAGVAYVLIEKPKEGMERLRTAAARTPRDAAVWSDLAAAQYAAALQLETPSLLPEALASADRALSIDAKRTEALFNRALILERLGLLEQARAAWDRYLAADPASAWSIEARKHLDALPRTNSDSLFRQQLPQLARGADVEAIVRRWREQSRAWGEAEFLGRFEEVPADLAIARALGAELRKQSGESLLADAVAAIDNADPATRTMLAEAHATYRRGRIAYSRQLPSAAEPDLRRAAELFAKASSPMERMARYYAANTRYDQNDVAGARVELERLLAEESPKYVASGALIRWELALCHNAEGDSDAALPLLIDAESALRRLDERSNLGFVEAMLADTYAALGRPEDEWVVRIRSFDALSRDGRGDRLLANLAGSVERERRAGNRDAALAMLAVERETARGAKDEIVLADNLTRGAVICSELGDVDGARRLVDEVTPIIARIADPAVRLLQNANLELARGAVSLHDDPRTALNELVDARAAYERMGQMNWAIDCRIFCARAATALGDPAGAAREIEAGIALLERLRLPMSRGVFAKGVLDPDDELYAQAIRLSLDRGDVAKAFAYVEQTRVRFGDAPHASVEQLRTQLGAADATLLEFKVLHDETVVFALDRSGLVAFRERVPREPAELYESLIRPALATHMPRTLIVVADPALDGVSFAGLYDARSHQRLIDQTRIVRAESAASLRATQSRPAPSRVVSVALPSGGSAALSDVGDEVASIAAAYPNAVQLRNADATFAAFVAAARDADVVHVSGHTHDDGNGGVAALDFAGANGSASQRIAWRSIAGAPLSHPRVVVLAACDSLRAPRFAAARAPSLGGAFLDAGAAEVIGTLEPIADREARELFRAIHRELAAGAVPADAVRHVQLQAMPGWRSIAVLTREIPDDRERRTP